jgi:hypothetical protein
MYHPEGVVDEKYFLFQVYHPSSASPMRKYESTIVGKTT